MTYRRIRPTPPKPEGKDEKEVPTEDPANCSITVTKRLTNIQGELLAVRAADFYVTLFSDEAMTQKAADTKMIHFDENQGTSSVTFDQLKRGTYYVAETDAEGKSLAEGYLQQWLLCSTIIRQAIK